MIVACGDVPLAVSNGKEKYKTLEVLYLFRIFL